MSITPPIPSQQLERIQPVVDALLAVLRERTQALTADIALPMEFDPEAGK
jgi:hypothetical protein